MTDVNVQQANQQPADANVDKDLDKKWKTDDEIRQEVVKSYDFDEEVDTDTIEKITKDKVEAQSNLQEAIKSKQNWREKAKIASEALDDKPKEEEKPKEDKIKSTIKETLEEERLNDLEMSDDIKKEVQSYAKLEGVSIKEAAKSDYIKFKLDQAKQAQKVVDAGIGGKTGSPAGQSSKDFSDVKDEDLKDMPDEEYEKFKEWRLKNPS